MKHNKYQQVPTIDIGSSNNPNESEIRFKQYNEKLRTDGIDGMDGE